MLKHKLFSDSLESVDFNSNMERTGDQTFSPFATSLRKMEIHRKQDCGDIPEIDSSQCSKDSDSDFLNERNGFLDNLERRPYTYDEDVQILKFVLKDQNIYKVTSILLWKYLETKKKNPKRSYQSLKNRFLRNIKPKIFTRYKNVIENEDQVRKILEKFPELKKDAKIKEFLSLDLKPREANNAVTVEKVQTADLNESLGKIRTQPPQQSNIREVISQIECDLAVDEESTTRKVDFCSKSISITVSRSLTTRASPSKGIKSQLGIYEKYLNCRAKNKLIPCPTCGRCGEPEFNEVQDSENECDVFISSSVENKHSKSSQDTTALRNKTHYMIDDAVIEKDVKRNKNRKAKSPFKSEQNSPDKGSFSLFLDDVRSSEKAGGQNGSAKQSKSFASKTTSSSASKRKYFTAPPEEGLGHLTDKELESLYQESVQKCEKLMSSEEEEALVKKCFKKNRRSFGFDSYVLLTKCNLDSFFTKSNSPPLEGLSADPVSSAETTGSPLVENMKRMLRSKTYKKC